MRLILHMEQRWVTRDGSVWVVRQIHRKDAQVSLQGPGSQPRYVTFAVLGRDYRPVG